MAENGVRDSKGRFIAGHPGNPKGRGKNPHAEAVAAVRRAAIDIALPALIEACQNGDLEAAKELARLGLPRLKPVTPMDAVDITKQADLTAKAESVLEVVTSGKVSAEQCEILLSALRVVAELSEVAGLKAKVAELEEKTAQGRVGVLLSPGIVDAETWLRAAKGADNGEEPKRS